MNLYCFDFFGTPVGHIDHDGAFFDSRGVQWAQLRGDNEVYDLAGVYLGRIGRQGSFVAANSTRRWYVRDWDWTAPPGVERHAADVEQVRGRGATAVPHPIAALRVRRGFLKDRA